MLHERHHALQFVQDAAIQEHAICVQAAWELHDGNHSSFFNETRSPPFSSSGITEAWKQSLRERQRRTSTPPPFATDDSPELVSRRSSVHSALDVRTPPARITARPSGSLHDIVQMYGGMMCCVVLNQNAVEITEDCD
jgi:hypothetical protein